MVGFFTSSQDEFQFLGPEWQLHEWHDQFEAFDRLLGEFEKAGYVAFLRVHPNLATKAHGTFRRERDGIRALARRHPELLVIWHDDFANTYSLLGVSDAVVVWDSTVGLEASARGIPVWTTATSRYGLIADVQERLSHADVDAGGVTPWDVDAHAAKRFIAYLVRRDQQMADDFRAVGELGPGEAARGRPARRCLRERRDALPPRGHQVDHRRVPAPQSAVEPAASAPPLNGRRQPVSRPS